MSEQPETRVVRAIRERLEGLGCYVLKVHGSEFAPAGFPDLVVVRPDGLTAYVEVKVPGRTDGPFGCGLSLLQGRALWMLGELGAPVGVACSADEAVAAVWPSWRR